MNAPSVTTAPRLSGSRVVVTGGARGIGGAIAARLAVEGADICILDRLVPEGTAHAAAIGGRFIEVDLLKPDDITRAMDEALTSLGGVANGFPRESGFDITVASEVMAILCLADDLSDLQRRLGDMIVAYRRDKTPVFARDLGADGATFFNTITGYTQPRRFELIEARSKSMYGPAF